MTRAQRSAERRAGSAAALGGKAAPSAGAVACTGLGMAAPGLVLIGLVAGVAPATARGDETKASGEAPAAQVAETKQHQEAPAPAPQPALAVQAAPAQGPVVAAKPALPPFEFHGYLRSGYGISSQHTKQEAFFAPGAGGRGGPPVKFRLGNETETYGEAILVNNWLNPNANSPARLKTQLLLAFLAFNNANFDASNLLTVREAFAEASGVLPGAREVKLWAGQRFYKRHDVHIIDFYFLDTSGYGGGVYDIPLGGSKSLAVAYIGGSTSDPALKLSRGFAARSMLDVRVSDIQALGGSLTVWLAGASVRGGTLANTPGATMPTLTGGAVGLVHKVDGVLGGFQQLALQFGNGPMTDFNSYYKKTISELPSAALAGDYLVQSAWRFRAVEALQIQPSPRLSLMGTAVLQVSDFGVAGGKGQETWFAIGARPVYHFTEHVSLAVEGGVDVVASQFAASGAVAKLTVAPQITPSASFWGRPVLRAYVTGATWTGSFKGLVGGAAFANSQLGLSTGVQLESWW